MVRDGRRRRLLGALAGGASIGLAGCTGLEAILGDSGPEGFEIPEDGEGVDPVDPTGNATLSASQSAWPTFGGDGGNTGSTAVSASANPLVHRWTAAYPDELLIGVSEPFAALVADGQVYTYRREVTTDDGREWSVVVALDAESGELTWTAPLNLSGGSEGSHEAYHPGTVVDGTLYVCSSLPGGDRDAVLALATETGEREWVTEVKGTLGGSPAVSDGVLYVSGTATVYALDAATGKGLWAADEGRYNRSVATDGDRVIAVPGDRMIAFDAETGERLWETDLPSVVNTQESPVIADGVVVYVHEHTGFAVDAADGEMLWRTDSEAVNGPRPAVRNGLAAFIHNGDGSATVRALDVGNGSVRWETAIGAEVHAPPVLTADRVFVASAGQTLYGLDVSNGSVIDERWYHGSSTLGEPAVTRDGVFVGHVGGVSAFERGELGPLPDIGGWVTAGADGRNTRRNSDATPPRSEMIVEWTARSTDPNRPIVAHGLVVVGDRGSLRAIEADSGEVRWRKQLADTRSFATTSPVAIDDLICATTSDGRVVAVRPEDGSVAWERDLDGEFVSPMTAADGVAYAVARDGSVYGLDAMDGRVVTTGRVGGQVAVGPAADDGRIYVSNGGIVAVDTDGNPLWSDAQSRYPALSPSVIDDGVAVAVNDGTVRGYDPSGRALWRADVYDVEEGISMHPTAVHDGDPIAAGFGNGSNPPVLAAIDGDSGDVRWRVEAESVETNPVVADGLVWIATGERFAGFDVKTGERIVTMPFPSEAGVTSTLVPVDDRVFCVDENTVYSLR